MIRIRTNYDRMLNGLNALISNNIAFLFVYKPPLLLKIIETTN